MTCSPSIDKNVTWKELHLEVTYRSQDSLHILVFLIKSSNHNSRTTHMISLAHITVVRKGLMVDTCIHVLFTLLPHLEKKPNRTP